MVHRPALGIAIWLLIRTVPEFYVSDATWVVCEEGEEPTTDRWFGENETWIMEIEEEFKDTGNCTASHEAYSDYTTTWFMGDCSWFTPSIITSIIFHTFFD